MANMKRNFAHIMHPYFENPETPETRKRLLGERLQEMRKAYHLTQKEIGGIIGVTVQTYSGYEKGKYEPSAETLVRLAYVYNTTVDYLLAKENGQNELRDEIETFDPENMEAVQLRLDQMAIEIEEFKRHLNSQNSK